MTELNIEKQNFEKVISEYDEAISDTKLKISNLPRLCPDLDLRIAEKKRLERKINQLIKNKEKPYFARIDFQNSKNSLKDVCYIGKVGLTNYDHKIITVDWRAPIATLYYDSNIGPASYMAPDGEINGNLLLKRQYNIAGCKLIDYNDVDTVSNDEILKPYLSVSADKRLKNIVATIQSEQNKIIREGITKNIIIQGVAGSGKTTVALHHIAYLVYNNRDIYTPDQYMVIGPNKFFIDYISSVLPDLDTDDVMQCDFVGLASNYLNIEFSVENSLDQFDKIETSQKNNFSYFRTSMHMKKKIDNYLKRLEDSFLPDEHLNFKDIKILDRSIIVNEYFSLNRQLYKSIESRIERTILRLTKEIDERKDKIMSTFMSKVYKEKNSEIQRKLIKEKELLKKELNVSGKNILKKYFKKCYFDVCEVYINVLKELQEEYLFVEEINDTIKNIKTRKVKLEDLTPLMYIKYKMYKDNVYSNYKHVVIDEAQDYNVFTFYILRKLLKNSTFSIYGDLAQSLYSNRSIANWNDITKTVFNNDISVMYLNKSYRTTIEIMNEANKINKYLNFPKAVPVIRHGANVEYINYKKDKVIDTILSEVKNMNLNGCKTIAIISKTKGQADGLYDILKDKIEIEKITSKNYKYMGNICVITGYLSKGLEFDGVIIVDVDNKNYNINDITDMKLLYVSMTRALHKLSILYSNTLLNIL